MNLPEVVKNLIIAQDNFDSVAYANCFTETAVVFDEGRTHNGKKEIEQWIAEANENYKSTGKPLTYEENGNVGVLKTEVSGTFPGSPIVLDYHFEFNGALLESLRITG